MSKDINFETTNIFGRMNRKQQREFNKLTPQKRGEIVVQEIRNQITAANSSAITKSIIRGYYMAYKELYENYVVKMKETESATETQDLTADLLAEIETVYNKTVSELDDIVEKDNLREAEEK